MWVVYILECRGRVLYTGVTSDLKRRTKEHKAGKGARFTRAFKPKKVVYSQAYATKRRAMQREAEIKSWPRQKKLALVGGM
jgi:putative endonuclease